jgi:hypothetical protein
MQFEIFTISNIQNCILEAELSSNSFNSYDKLKKSNLQIFACFQKNDFGEGLQMLNGILFILA